MADLPGDGVRVLLADSHPIFVMGLEHVLACDPRFTVVACCRSAEELLAATRTVTPDLLVLDIRMPGTSGLAALRELREQGSRIPAVILTAGLTEDEAEEARSVGVRTVLLKDTSPTLLLRWLWRAHADARSAASAGPAERRLSANGSDAGFSRALTPRELEIARMVALGLRNRVMARQLAISEGTVKIHLHNIYEKLELTGRFALAVWARERALVA